MRFLIVILSIILCSDAATDRIQIDAIDIINAHNPFAKKEAPIKNRIKKTEKQKPIFQLDAIFENSALINNEWVQTGKSIEGYTLEELREDGVILRNSNDLIVLRLYEDWGLR